jgi:hypothetical protein
VQFGDLPLQLIAERALFISMAKFARSLVTCHCSLVSCHCSLVSCHCSLVSCQCSLVSCHCSLVSCHCSLVSCHCSLVSCHCSLVCCHCSLVSCHCSLINVSPRTTTTTKQNLDPRCTYVQTRVKMSKFSMDQFSPFGPKKIILVFKKSSHSFK